MSVRNHVIFWSLTALIFIVALYVLKSVLLPFVLGGAVAYLLNPLVHAFGKINIGRGYAALIITASFMISVIGILAAISPLLYKQSLDLAESLPVYGEQIYEWAAPFIHKTMAGLGETQDQDFKALLQGPAGNGADMLKKLMGGLMAGGQAFAGMLSVLVITPVVAYFLMKEWDNITGFVEGLLPRDQKKTIVDLIEKIDAKISGFVRGQISVALILGVAYALALSIAGLNYGFLIGLGAGLLSVIPMVGSAIGLLVSVLVAWFQAGEWAYVGIIAAIFLVGQFIEGNFLTPKLVGDSVGLHPLWVFFALLAGGSLFGILGMLLAVPVAAVIGVLLAFAIAQYKMSPYFKGVKKTPSSKRKKNTDNA